MRLIITHLGVAPNPCPTVAEELPLPVYFTILNPAAEFALTVDDIDPVVFVELELAPFQQNATKS